MLSRSFDLLSLSSDILPEDDVDQLFQRLEPLAAPVDIVQRVLARIQQLSEVQRYQPACVEQDDSQLLPGTQGASGAAL
jgi:hypothetical protein